MITKQQWRKFVGDVDKYSRLIDTYGTAPTIRIHGHKFNHVRDDAIYCEHTSQGLWYILTHPESLDDTKRMEDLYRAVKIEATMAMLRKKKSDA